MALNSRSQNPGCLRNLLIILFLETAAAGIYLSGLIVGGLIFDIGGVCILVWEEMKIGLAMIRTELKSGVELKVILQDKAWPTRLAMRIAVTCAPRDVWAQDPPISERLSPKIWGLIYIVLGFTLQAIGTVLLPRPPHTQLLGSMGKSLGIIVPSASGVYSHIADFLAATDWQAVGAIGTLLVVVVALFPIWHEGRRKKAQARSLRLRLCSKLILLRPSLDYVIRGGGTSYPDAVFPQETFRETVRLVMSMMTESSALEPDEQDQLGLVLVNLESLAVLYRTETLSADSAKNTLDLMDRAVAIMEKHGLLSGAVDKPWDK